jgi:NitT/TauT family transport system permease protein
LSNVFLGVLLAIVVGLGVGTLIGLYLRRFDRIFLPFFRVCEKLNLFALFPLFMIFFGTGRLEKVAVVFWASVWPLIFSTVDGSHRLDRSLLKSARSMGAKRSRLLVHVIAPLMVPYFFTGLKSATTLSFFMIIASEMVGSTNGLGWLYIRTNFAYDLPLLYGVILLITVMSILINLLFSFIEKRFQAWKPAVTFE